VDLSQMYADSVSSGRDNAASSTNVAFCGGCTVIDFPCHMKNSIGFLTKLVLQLDLESMVLKQQKAGAKDFTGITLDCIVSAEVARGRGEVDLQIMQGGGHGSDGHLLGGAPATSRMQRYFFANQEDAVRFQMHLNVMKESGRKLRLIFQEIDRRNTGHITAQSLLRSMKDNGMTLDVGAADEEGEIHAMINLADADTSDGIDFAEFFRLFMYTPCVTVHQALSEWRNKLTLVQKKPSSSSMSSPRIMSTRVEKFDNTWTVGGEFIMNVVENVRYSFGYKARDNLDGEYNHHWAGTLSVTNYRLVLSSARSGVSTIGTRHEISKYFDRMDIPANCIASVTKLDSSCLQIMCKDLRPILCSFDPNDLFVTTLVNAIQMIAFPNGDAKKTGGPAETFAFNLHLDVKPTSDEPLKNGWDLYDPMVEFKRIGVIDSPHSRFYRLWSDNFTMSDTYPRHFVVPSGMSESEIMKAAKFRSKCRMPVVSWRSMKNGAVLVRSAQPMVGLKNSRNESDEKLLNLYRVKGDPHNPLELDDPSTLYILDARKMIAATGNQVQGKGTEVIGNYSHCELTYCNIENIHTMRDSVNALGAASLSLDRANKTDSKYSWEEQVTNSGWLRHVQGVLKASVLACERIEMNDSSVLIHCSDGWDRTSQMSATTMLCLDPYYRTIEGFAILIEKEWLEFGHKFKDRHGQGNDKHPNERSPVFVQWLDTIHQIMRQFPTALEFNETLLVFLADHVHSCLFGTFLGNSAKERDSLGVKNKTVSIWTYVLVHKERYTNKKWGGAERTEVLWPSCSIKQIAVWHRYFSRWDQEAHPRGSGEYAEIWQDDWGKKL
jgi:myotubularin-related protein 1/2